MAAPPISRAHAATWAVVAMLRDGSIVGVDGWRAWRLAPDGRRTTIPGLSGTGVVAAPSGGVLALQGAPAPACPS